VTTVHCLPYSCTLSVASCAKRHLAAIQHRTGDLRETAYPSCRRCPIGAENARATRAEAPTLERVRVSRLGDNPVPRAPSTVPHGEHCTIPGCDRLRGVARPNMKPELAPLCALCRDEVSSLRRRHRYKLSLAEYVARVAARRTA